MIRWNEHDNGSLGAMNVTVTAQVNWMAHVQLIMIAWHIYVIMTAQIKWVRYWELKWYEWYMYNSSW